MSMKFDDFSALVKRTVNLVDDYEDFLKDFLLQMGLRALGKAKSLTPRDIGAGGGLISKWELSEVHRSGDDLYIILSNSAEYASHVEDGHMQHERFLPIHHLEKSPHGKKLAAQIRAKYGSDANGIMLKEKWIPGVHMARISIDEVQKQMPARLNRQFQQFMKSKGLG